MINRSAVAVCAALAFAGAVWPQAGQAGSSAFAFLNLDFDARTMAMAGVAVAMPNDLYGVTANPAVAGFISTRQVMCGYRSIMGDVWGGPVAAALPYVGLGTFALNLENVSYGSLAGVDEGPDGSPEATGVTWNSYSIVGGLTWAKIIWDRLSIGGSLREVHDYIGNSGGPDQHVSADAVMVNAGLQYRWFGSRVIAGLAFNNAGFMISSYDAETEDLKMPLSVTAGASYTLYYLPNLRLALDLTQPSDGLLAYKLGGEFDVYKKFLTLRAGYSWSESDLESQLNVLQGEPAEGYTKTNWTGLCLGVGVNTDIGTVNMGFDAAVQFIDGMDPVLALSVIAAF